MTYFNKIQTLLGNIKSVEPGYNELGLRGTSPIASDILWYQFSSLCLSITLHCSVITTLVYNDTIYSVPVMTL
jgi:hypothetical protein